jgi:hypothetical protein
MGKYRSLATLLLLPLIQCQDNSVTGPDIPDEIRATAIKLHVNVTARTVTQINTPSSPDISFSLVGSDAVSVQASNFTQTALGKNKLTVRFDVAITNSLTNVTLVHPSSPAPTPSGTGLLLFPVQATPTAGSGSITASSDWDGDPFNFLNGAACKGTSSGCYRWEEYTAPLGPGQGSAARSVGFEMDRNIQDFDVVMLLSADLENGTPGPAAIALSQTTANFEYRSGSTTPSMVSLAVTNSGGGTLTGLTKSITYGTDQPTGWLDADLSSGTAPASLDLRASRASLLSDGTYNASVAVASDGASNSPQNVSVTVVVTGGFANAIYVSESDPRAINDSGCGLSPFGQGYPCRSIAQGLARANATSRPEVRVADGHYTEAVSLSNGKNLLGGYRPDTWERHLATTNTIIDGVSSAGNHDRTIVAINITSPTLFEGFVVRGSVNAKTGGSSYAVYVSNSPGLAIQHNVIYAGTGGPGAQGTAGTVGAAGPNGTGREFNAAAYDATIASGAGQCDTSNNRSYANKGVSVAGADDISGGNGGGNACPTSSTLMQMSALDGASGNAGDPAGGGAAGTGGVRGYDFRLESSGSLCVAAAGPQDGSNGSVGGNGQAAAAVAGATSATGSVISGNWVGASGTNGTAGSNGGGGGGGAGGGGAYSQSTLENKDRLGGHGGGGGAGGAGGTGGSSGSAGGGAFGIFILGGAPVITDNTIVRGNGGNGGNGGAGAAGGQGGQGGNGGLGSLFCTGSGGRGGDGGSGGAGSGGGGGSGGAAFGIYTSGAGTPAYCSSSNNSISGGIGGSGGQGGPSSGNPGGTGVSGTVGTCSFN